MNWTEFHFFKHREGLSKNDAAEMLACLDYEQTLECKAIVDLLPSIAPAERNWMLGQDDTQADTYKALLAIAERVGGEYAEQLLERIQRSKIRPHSRFTRLRATSYNREHGDEWSAAPFADVDKAMTFPPIPAVCVAASWFPKHWLAASSEKRRHVLDQVRILYPISRLPMFPFPMDAEETELLARSLAERETLHVIAIDRTLPKSALVEKFKDWVSRQDDIDGSSSRKGKINVPAMLNDLACYRLSKLDVAPRLDLMGEAGFGRSEARLSQAKARAAMRLRKLRYI